MEAPESARSSSADACKVAWVNPVKRTDSADPRNYAREYQCRTCKKNWYVGPCNGSGPDGEYTQDELRGSVPFWLCPKGCNAKRQTAVYKVARGPRERMLVGPLDAAMVEAARVALREREKKARRSTLARDAWARRKAIAQQETEA